MHARLSYIIIGGTMDWVELLLKNAALRFLAEFPEFCVENVKRIISFRPF
jgi:hypothetical protein